MNRLPYLLLLCVALMTPQMALAEDCPTGWELTKAFRDSAAQMDIATTRTAKARHLITSQAYAIMVWRAQGKDFYISPGKMNGVLSMCQNGQCGFPRNSAIPARMRDFMNGDYSIEQQKEYEFPPETAMTWAQKQLACGDAGSSTEFIAIPTTQALSAKEMVTRGSEAYNEEDYDTAHRYFQQGCDLNEANGCYNLALIYYSGRGRDANLANARALFDKSCHLGTVLACFRYGQMLNDGEGGASNQPKAREIFTLACQANFAKACFNLGIFAHKGKGGAQDLALAQNSFQAGCDGDDSKSCTNLAAMVLNGQGSIADPVKARTLFEKSCGLNDGAACNNLGMMVQKGQGGEKDSLKAAALFNSGCALNDATSCYHYGMVYSDSLATKDYREQAHIAFKKACDLGENRACEKLNSIGDITIIGEANK